MSSRGEPSNGVTRQKPTMDDALEYLRKVKATIFEDKKEQYDAFLDALVNFRGGRIGATSVIAGVKELLKDHEDLIRGFNIFVPKGCEITLPLKQKQPPEKKDFDYFDALDFSEKVHARFERNDDVYRFFLELLRMYRIKAKSKTEVYNDVVGLFKDHPNLLEEFTAFMP